MEVAKTQKHCWSDWSCGTLGPATSHGRSDTRCAVSLEGELQHVGQLVLRVFFETFTALSPLTFTAT